MTKKLWKRAENHDLKEDHRGEPPVDPGHEGSHTR
jgi:hypothetical protein